ncbi:MAG: polyprenyl glycosylphosphotransferase [Candidatus Hydrogenedentota bacterium]
MTFLKRNAGALTLAMVACDMACAVAAALLAAYLLMPLDGSATLLEVFMGYRVYVIAFVIVWYLVASDQGLFGSHRSDSLGAQLGTTAYTLAFALGVTIVVALFFERSSIDREFFGIFGFTTFVLILTFRATIRLALWSIRRRGYNFRHILIIGANPRARRLVEVMLRHGQFGYRLVGVLDDEPERIEHLKNLDIHYLGPVAELENVLLNQVIDEAYICLPVRKYYSVISSVAHLCEGVGVPVRLMADLFPLRLATSRVHQLEDIPVLSVSAVPEAHAQLILKRVIDMAVATAFLVLVASWLFPFVALAIKLESRGPVFFLQERVGLNGRRFKCRKFRSMVQNAEALKAQLAQDNEADGPVFKIRNDPRMTRVGKWIRKFSIDETPQFLNVFFGDMSIVGPRPPVPSEVEKYTWDQRRRLSVRPGITGLQQVSGRSDLSFDEWVEIDLAYIDNWSLLQDIRIMFRTIQVVVTARGAA